MNKVTIGTISANIAGDYRYTDTLRVELDVESNTVTISVFTTGAVGGMDGPGGATEPRADFTSSCPADPKATLALVKGVLAQGRYNFKNYGKPTKNFRWVGVEKRGLSLALVKQAIELARE